MMKKIIPIIGTLLMLSCADNNDSTSPFLTFSQTVVSLSPVSNTSTEVIVKSNVAWELSFSSEADWLSIDKMSGTGNDTIHIVVLNDNDGDQARTAILTATASKHSPLQAQLTFEQENYNLQLLSQKVLGGTSVDELDAIIPLSDGSVVLAGYTSSSQSGMVGKNHGSYDGWVVKLNSDLDTVWTRVIGSSGIDVIIAGTAADDGGFVLAAYTSAVDGDVTGTITGKDDLWIIKMNTDGEIEWTTLVGGAFNDFPKSIAATADGNFVVAGQTYTSNSEVDALVVKLNNSGEVVWQKKLGGIGGEAFMAVDITTDGNIMLTGYTASDNTGDVGANHGGQDVWVVKLDADGEVVWNKLFGGSASDSGESLTMTADGGYIIIGTTLSSASGDVVGTNKGDRDIWVFKLNASGDIIFNAMFGGSSADYARSMISTTDGGCIVSGSVKSNNGDIESNHGNSDFWLMKLNSSGQKVWSKNFGGSADDYIDQVVFDADNNLCLSGYTLSNNSGDVGVSYGNGDAWFLKVKDF